MRSKEIGWYGRDWIYLFEDWDKRWLLLNVVMNFQVPENVGSVLNR
jgi:hypothetical protein